MEAEESGLKLSTLNEIQSSGGLTHCEHSPLQKVFTFVVMKVIAWQFSSIAFVSGVAAGCPCETD